MRSSSDRVIRSVMVLPHQPRPTIAAFSIFSLLFGSGGVRDVAFSIAADAHVGLFGMACEPFEHAKARAFLANHGTRLVGGDALVCACFQELADPKAACVPRRLTCGKGMVGADDLVTEGDIGARTKKEGAVVG